MTAGEIYWWLALERAPFVGPITISKLMSAFGNPRTIIEAGTDVIKSTGLVSSRIAESLGSYKPDDEGIQQDIETLARLDARVMTRWDEDYPKNLLEIYDPPAILFVRGEFQAKDDLAIAVVGSRASSNYGDSVTTAITRDLVRSGVCVVSGLARGIDTVCHATALNEGGRTIGVLGCGLDINYPSENKALIERMAREGVVMSEFRPGSEPLRTNFFRRNRIVSGLSKAVVVVEASRRSGSMITVNHALDQGRDVFAVPGNVLHERSRGPHSLIKQGAGLVESAQDILSVVFPPSLEKASLQPTRVTPTVPNVDVSETAQKVLDCLDADPFAVDTLCQMSGLQARNVLTALMELELLGLVKQSPGKLFSRKE